MSNSRRRLLRGSKSKKTVYTGIRVEFGEMVAKQDDTTPYGTFPRVSYDDAKVETSIPKGGFYVEFPKNNDTMIYVHKKAKHSLGCELRIIDECGDRIAVIPIRATGEQLEKLITHKYTLAIGYFTGVRPFAGYLPTMKGVKDGVKTKCASPSVNPCPQFRKPKHSPTRHYLPSPAIKRDLTPNEMAFVEASDGIFDYVI